MAQWVLERVVWKSVSMRPGELCQIMDGQSQRLAWYADNLAILDSVSLLYCKTYHLLLHLFVDLCVVY